MDFKFLFESDLPHPQQATSKKLNCGNLLPNVTFIGYEDYNFDSRRRMRSGGSENSESTYHSLSTQNEAGRNSCIVQVPALTAGKLIYLSRRGHSRYQQFPASANLWSRRLIFLVFLRRYTAKIFHKKTKSVFIRKRYTNLSLLRSRIFRRTDPVFRSTALQLLLVTN